MRSTVNLRIELDHSTNLPFRNAGQLADYIGSLTAQSLTDVESARVTGAYGVVESRVPRVVEGIPANLSRMSDGTYIDVSDPNTDWGQSATRALDEDEELLATAGLPMRVVNRFTGEVGTAFATYATDGARFFRVQYLDELRKEIDGDIRPFEDADDPLYGADSGPMDLPDVSGSTIATAAGAVIAEQRHVELEGTKGGSQ